MDKSSVDEWTDSALSGEQLVKALTAAKGDLRLTNLDKAAPCPAYVVSGLWRPTHSEYHLMGHYFLDSWDAKNHQPVYRLRWDVWGQEISRAVDGRTYYLRFNQASRSWCITSSSVSTHSPLLKAQHMEVLQLPSRANILFAKPTEVSAAGTAWLSLVTGSLLGIEAVCNPTVLKQPWTTFSKTWRRSSKGPYQMSNTAGIRGK